MNTLPLQFLMLIFAGWVNRHQQDVIEYLQEENRSLREQLGGKRLRFTDQQRRRLALKAKQVGRRGLVQIETLVTPDTLLRWYRQLIARKYDGSESRRPGRPKTAVEIRELVLRMARENPRWGYTRIRGALYNLGHEIGRNTIKRILLENGFDPIRKKGMSWETFLKAQCGGGDKVSEYRGNGLLQRRSDHAIGLDSISCFVRHRPQDSSSQYHRDSSPTQRRVDEADRAKPHRL
jgi:hypothetical protein